MSSAWGLIPRQAGVLVVFALVYVGMVLGGWPRLALNRAGVALLGGTAVVALGVMNVDTALRAVDGPTLALLFAFMVLSAQMRLGGFYSAVSRAWARWALSEPAALGALIGVVALLSAVFSNDVVCLAMTPLVVQAALQRGWDARLHALALACAANIGSAATLIGNPQNMLIASAMRLDMAAYSRAAFWPVAWSLCVLWLWLVGPARWWPARPETAAGGAVPLAQGPEGPERLVRAGVPFDAWQSAKGLAVAAALMAVFLFTDWPRETAALVGAGVLLLSRRMASHALMGLVDWELLVLFVGLFVVNAAFAQTGWPEQAVAWLRQQGVDLNTPAALLAVGLGLSNLVSNVPAVMLMLPHLQGARAATLLALVSTLAGNLLLVGSIANLIVADAVRDAGLRLDWRAHARVGGLRPGQRAPAGRWRVRPAQHVHTFERKLA